MRILAVCLGNICRSPTAEGVLRSLAKAEGADVIVDSAGTGSWHIGDPPYEPAVRAALSRGYDISGQRARQIETADFDRFDLIIAMDRKNIGEVESLRPRDNATPVRLLLEFAPDVAAEEVPDPYYTGNFHAAIDMIEAAARGLVAQLQTDAANAPKAL